MQNVFEEWYVGRLCYTETFITFHRSRAFPFPFLLDTGNSNDSFYSDRFYEFSSVGWDPSVERVATLMYMVYTFGV